MAITTFNGPVASQNGFLLPSFTNAEIFAIPNPTAGLMVFNSTADTTAYYNGTTWVGATPPPPPPPPVTPVTYTAGVDYEAGSPLQWAFTSSQVSISGVPWSNATGYYNMLATPSGTVYTATAASGTGTITTTAVWGGGGGLNTVGGTGTGAFAPAGMLPPADILSITFIPTTLPYLGGRSPGFGPEAGGTTVTLSGLNFTGATAVTFGGVAVASFSVVNETTITAVTPPGTGNVPIVVTTPLGTAGGRNFAYEP